MLLDPSAPHLLLAYASVAAASLRILRRNTYENARAETPEKYDNTSYATRDAPHASDTVSALIGASLWPLVAVAQLCYNRRERRKKAWALDVD